MDHVQAGHRPPKKRYEEQLSFEDVGQRMRHTAREKKGFPGRLMFRTQNDALVIV